MTTPRIIFIQTQNRMTDPPRAAWCESFLCRLRGLTFHSPITRDEGLLLAFGRDSRVDPSIHMQVVDKVVAGAWKPAYFPKSPARYVLEVHASRIGDFEIGQFVQFQNA